MWNTLLALTTAKIALIAACAAIGLALIIAGVVGLIRQKRSQGAAEAQPEPTKAEPEQPATEEPATEEPIAERPAEEEPATEEPAAEEPAAEQPIAEEPAQEVKEQPQEQPAAAPSKPQEARPAEKTRVVYTDEDGWYIQTRYDKSFEAKLIQGGAKLKSYYTELKNELLSYQKVTARRSWHHEAFRRGRVTVAKLAIRGKTLRLYLALDPAPYEESKYLVEDASSVAKFAKTPLLYRIKNDRRCRYAKDLIAAAMAAVETEQGEVGSEPYGDLPYEDTQTLLERGLVRIIEVRRRAEHAGMVVLPVEEEYEEDEEPAEEISEEEIAEEEPIEELVEEEPVEEPIEEEPEEEPAPAPHPVTVEEVREEHRVSVAAAETLMADEEAELLVELSERESDRRRQTIVNIDTLSEYFSDGERADLEAMKARIPFLDKRATYVKVLARGILTKTLEVEADDFSLDAVKMIVLLGGKVYRTKR